MKFKQKKQTNQTNPIKILSMQKRDFLNLPLYFNSNNGQKRITDFIQKNRP